MKVYFEDGDIVCDSRSRTFFLTADNGVSECYNTLEDLYNQNYKMGIYTNSWIATDPKYCTNVETGKVELYIRNKTDFSNNFAPITDFTLKEIMENENYGWAIKELAMQYIK